MMIPPPLPWQTPDTLCELTSYTLGGAQTNTFWQIGRVNCKACLHILSENPQLEVYLVLTYQKSVATPTTDDWGKP